MSADVPPPNDPPPPDPSSSGRGRGDERGYDRVPPHSLDAEVSVLGACLLSVNAVVSAVELLKPADFYRNAHRVVFEAVVALNASNEPIDTVSVTEWLARRGRLDEVGGAAAIHDLTDAVPTAANAGFYARLVRDKAVLRRLIDAGTEVARLGYEATEDASAVVDRAEAMIYELARTGEISEFTALSDLLSETFAQIEKLAEQRSEVTGLATGFDDLDRLTAGLQKQNLVIIAARPSMGKCLVGATRVLDARDGTWRRLDALVAEGPDDLAVLAADADGRLVRAAVTDLIDNGVREVLTLVTRAGRTLTATPSHPLLTPSGWRELGALTHGDAIAAVDDVGAALAAAPHLVPALARVGGVGAGSATEGAPRADDTRPVALDWDAVARIEPAGHARVYDLTVPGVHNFVAESLVVHNSALALGIAQYVGVHVKRPVILFSLEMSSMEIVNRLLSAEARVDSGRLRTGRLDDRDWLKLGDALGTLSEAPLYIDDSSSTSLMEIRAKARRLKQRHGDLGLVIVDYLQLMQSHRRTESRQQEVSEISRGLKMLAKELDTPVIALSQLSRQPESRTDKRPMLADLRESGSIEQDADIVGFIYNDAKYDEDSPDKGIVELIIAKHRNGATGTIRLAFLEHLAKFANLERARRPGAPGAPGGQGVPVGAPDPMDSPV